MAVARRWWGLALAGLLCAGCGLPQQWREQAYREYHAARLAEVGRAYAVPQAEARLSGAVAVPNLCRATVDPLYGELLDLAWQEELSWRALLLKAEEDCRFAQQTVEAMAARDTAKVGVLAPQIAANAQARAKLSGEYAAVQARTAAAMQQFSKEWAKLWPGNRLSFDLAAACDRARSNLPAVAPEQAAALERYHANEYARLAMIYLNYQPDPLPEPVSQVPPGAEALSRTLANLETGLAARCALDEAMETEVELVRELTGATGAVDWATLAPPEAKYQAVRYDAALARLKLYKYLDQLVTTDLDALCREVDLAWARAWPNSGVETNIFAFAGLSEQGQATPAAPSGSPAGQAPDAAADYSTWTFRRSMEQWEPPR